MRRTDRLFDIIQRLRSARKPLSAASMAESLEVSQRTIYRDIATLQSMTVPIEGEAGVGYIMRAGYDLPPLDFTVEEREAIVVGLGLVARTGDARLREMAERVLSKIEQERLPRDALRVSDWGIDPPPRVELAFIRQAIREERKLWIAYVDGHETRTERLISPLALTYFVEVAVVAAWCGLREDFRHFRVDRIVECRPTEQFFRGKGAVLRRELDAASTE